MTKINPRMYFHGWLIAAVLAFIAAGIEYAKSGEILTTPLLLGIIGVAMAVLSRGKRRPPPA